MRDKEIGQSVALLRDALQDIRDGATDMLVWLDDWEFYKIRGNYLQLMKPWGVVGVESAFLHETHPRTQEVIRKELGLMRRE